MKPSEVKLVASMLEDEHPDAQSLAKAIIKALDDKRATDDKTYVLGAMLEGMPLLWGPFATPNQAAKAAEKLVAPRPLQGRVMRVWRVGDTIE